jgi:hypothetical protein
MTLLIKQIKPSKLRVDRFRLEMLNEMRKVGTEVKRDYEKTTATWKHKPKFEVVVSLTGPGPVLLVGTDDEIYRYVSEGTKPHPIFAGIYTGKSDKKVLAFPVRSAPKTRPGQLRSMPGFKSKKKLFRPYVMHPGTKPRRFEEAIKKLWTKKFKRRMEAAMSRAIRKSGYSASR